MPETRNASAPLLAAIERLPSLGEGLRAAGFRPSKALGQHFLLDLNLTRKIARAAAPEAAAIVIEVGPGPGGLSRALLLEGAPRLVAIEKDAQAEALLRPLIAASAGRFSVQISEALGLDLTRLGPAPRVICANLPYNVGTPLLLGWLRQLSADPQAYARLVLLFQREVAQRLVAQPGSKAYGRLSVISQYLCQVERLFDIPADAFTPPPQVVSSLLRLTPKPASADRLPLEPLERVTAAAFGQRRKSLRQSLKQIADSEALLGAAGIDPSRRAETLTLEEFTRLARIYAEPQSSAKVKG